MPYEHGVIQPVFQHSKELEQQAAPSMSSGSSLCQQPCCALPSQACTALSVP